MKPTQPSRRRKPSMEKRLSFESPSIDGLWIFDEKARATFYPTKMTNFKRIVARLKSEGKKIKTSLDEK